MYTPIFDIFKNGCTFGKMIAYWKWNGSKIEIGKHGNGNNSKGKIRANMFIHTSMKGEMWKVLSRNFLGNICRFYITRLLLVKPSDSNRKAMNGSLHICQVCVDYTILPKGYLSEYFEYFSKYSMAFSKF